MWSGNNYGYDNSEMLMPRLCADTPLTDCTFSFHLTSESVTSYLDFGAPDSSIVTDPTESAWIYIEEKSLRLKSMVTGFRWDQKSEWGKKKTSMLLHQLNAFLALKLLASMDLPEDDIFGIF